MNTIFQHYFLKALRTVVSTQFLLHSRHAQSACNELLYTVLLLAEHLIITQLAPKLRVSTGGNRIRRTAPYRAHLRASVFPQLTSGCMLANLRGHPQIPRSQACKDKRGIQCSAILHASHACGSCIQPSARHLTEPRAGQILGSQKAQTLGP